MNFEAWNVDMGYLAEALARKYDVAGAGSDIINVKDILFKQWPDGKYRPCNVEMTLDELDIVAHAMFINPGQTPLPPHLRQKLGIKEGSKWVDMPQQERKEWEKLIQTSDYIDFGPPPAPHSNAVSAAGHGGAQQAKADSTAAASSANSRRSSSASSSSRGRNAAAGTAAGVSAGAKASSSAASTSPATQPAATGAAGPQALPGDVAEASSQRTVAAVGTGATGPPDVCAQCGVGGRFKRCSACDKVRYCSTACQRKHWKSGHKAECKKPASSCAPGGNC